MPKQLLSIPSFTAGELSSSMEGRTDFAKYFNGASNIENFVVLPHGPVSRRPGTYFVSEVKTSANSTRLIPFTFSTEQTYVLEFGNQYIRFFKDNGQITEGNKTITAITAANPAVVTSSSHGYSNGDFVNISGVVGMTEEFISVPSTFCNSKVLVVLSATLKVLPFTSVIPTTPEIFTKSPLE